MADPDPEPEDALRLPCRERGLLGAGQWREYTCSSSAVRCDAGVQAGRALHWTSLHVTAAWCGAGLESRLDVLHWSALEFTARHCRMVRCGARVQA